MKTQSGESRKKTKVQRFGWLIWLAVIALLAAGAYMTWRDYYSRIYRTASVEIGTSPLSAEVFRQRGDVDLGVPETSVQRDQGKPQPTALTPATVCNVLRGNLLSPLQPVDGTVYRKNGAIVEIVFAACGDSGNRIARGARGILPLKPIILYLLEGSVLLAALRRANDWTVRVHVHRKAHDVRVADGRNTNRRPRSGNVHTR